MPGKLQAQYKIKLETGREQFLQLLEVTSTRSEKKIVDIPAAIRSCLLYTSDAADE